MSIYLEREGETNEAAEPSAHLWRRQDERADVVERLGEQFVSEDGAQVTSHHCLLLHRAVVLQGQDQRVGRRLQPRFRSAQGHKKTHRD